ncbi:putative amidases related to nicotinamidase [Fusarium austroafricanum]|uniref:Putative amidases related to nicotinamidase n=1 Tax=Fusarium austroafricanum TaxID=2364996 RepID=A0A8H4NW90_9HYPO|nr:putative amidases related to nicotinamidase [Fusarium austroafricanum]
MASATSFRELVGVPPSTASPSDSVLIIIDAQNEYAEGMLQVANVTESRKAIASLLEKYRAANGSIVHVVHDTPEGAPVFTPGTKLAEEFEELKPKDGETLIHKNFPGSFTKTDLQEVLNKTGKKKVVLTGYMADELGYDVLIPEDAVGDRSIPGVDAAQLVKVSLSEIGDAFGTIIKSSSIA